MTVATDDTSVEALLTQVLVELQAIRQAFERDRPSTLGRGDRTALERLLPAIAGTLGSELFTSKEVIEHPSPALRLVCGDMNAKVLGKLLARGNGQPIGGYVVTEDGAESNVRLWRVKATC